MSIHYPTLQLDNYKFPFWSYQLGWGLTALILSGMILYIFYVIIKLLLVQGKVKMRFSNIRRKQKQELSMF